MMSMKNKTLLVTQTSSSRDLINLLNHLLIQGNVIRIERRRHSDSSVDNGTMTSDTLNRNTQYLSPSLQNNIGLGTSYR